MIKQMGVNSLDAKKNFRDFSVWSDDDVSAFLVSDYFDTYRKIPWAKDITEESFIHAQKIHLEKYNRYGLLVKLLDWIFLILYRWDQNPDRIKILFQESKYAPLVFEAKKKYQVRLLVQGKKDRLFAVKNGIGYMALDELDQLACSYLQEKNPAYLHQLIIKVQEKLSIVRPDYIVLTYDVFPIERAIILVARKLGIPTLVIQHAIYDLPSASADFKAADYVLVWGNYFKDFCVNQQMRNTKDIYVLGYPCTITRARDTNKEGRFLTICYLGQDFQRHNNELLPIKLETINNLAAMCKKLHVAFMYRSHYAEDRKLLEQQLPGVLFTPKKESLEDTFERADVLVSFSSTSLVEAAMRGKVSLQLKNYPIETDNFEAIGACSKSFESLGALEAYLETIVGASTLDGFKPKFNINYIETPSNPGEKFLDILDQIGKKRYGT